jgi:hypothetical protein
MKKILTGIILILALSCVASNAQDRQSFMSKVDANFQNKHPDWILEHKQTVRTDTEYIWKAGKDMWQFVVGYPETEEQAKKRFWSHIDGFPSGYHNDGLRGIGDEAYLIGDRNRACTIVFRKSNVVVLIKAPSFAMGEALAKEIAELIPNN